MARCRIVVHAVGGDEIGLGHVVRAAALRAALRDRGATVELIVEGPPWAREHGGEEDVYGADSAPEALALHQRLGSASDALVLDLPERHLAEADAEALAGLYPKSACLDDGDCGLAPDLHFRTAPYWGGPDAGPGRGASYLIVAPKVAERRPDAPWRGSRITSGLVAFGGSDPAFATEAFARELPAELSWTIACGPGFGANRVREIETSATPGIRVLPRVPDLASQILAHDLLLTLGGQTAYEAMCLGRAVLAPRWRHLERHVAGLADLGLLADLGPLESAPGRLNAAIADPEALAETADSGWSVVDGRGSIRSADLIIHLAQS